MTDSERIIELLSDVRDEIRKSREASERLNAASMQEWREHFSPGRSRLQVVYILLFLLLQAVLVAVLVVVMIRASDVPHPPGPLDHLGIKIVDPQLLRALDSLRKGEHEK